MNGGSQGSGWWSIGLGLVRDLGWGSWVLVFGEFSAGNFENVRGLVPLVVFGCANRMDGVGSDFLQCIDVLQLGRPVSCLIIWISVRLFVSASCSDRENFPKFSPVVGGRFNFCGGFGFFFWFWCFFFKFLVEIFPISENFFPVFFFLRWFWSFFLFLVSFLKKIF